MRFKVGDYVTGKPDNNYGYTNSSAIMVVTEAIAKENKWIKNEIKVKILERSIPDVSGVIGSSFRVESHDFVKIKITEKQRLKFVVKLV